VGKVQIPLPVIHEVYQNFKGIKTAS
jgi:hypothetical protein